jgi:hypothetical protein
MNILKLSLLTLPLILFSIAQAQDPDTSTFPVDEEKSIIQEKDEIQQEEERLDSFGEDTYNQNFDPGTYEIEKEEDIDTRIYE